MLRLVSKTDEVINLCVEGISLVYGGILVKPKPTDFPHALHSVIKCYHYNT